ncbi:hypothetical protein FDECE_10237 [Fusarium decemcellulare]|nr:hypothetical protein FDECE_10237 [Fusarium decemcellulare]
MAGAKKPVNIFKIYRGDAPKQIFNWRLWMSVLTFGLMGAARGIDEGLIGGVFSSRIFQELIGVDEFGESEFANVKGNVVAMVNIGSVGGALLASIVCDRVGRIWATRILCALWAIGIAIFMGNNGHLGAVYAGRFIAGLGIGQTTVVAPVYIAEIAPPSVRGLCTCLLSGAVYVGIVLAYFMNWGCSIHMPDGNARWLVPTSLHLMFAGIIFVMSFIFGYESPRYLVSVGRHKAAVKSLSHIRNLPTEDPYIRNEVNTIEISLAHEKEAAAGLGIFGLFKEMFLIPCNFYRIYLGIIGQLLSQWSGGPSITIYAVNLFAILGIKGQNESLFSTAIFGVVKFISALICALFLVDIIGRKKSLLIGIAFQSISMLYVASFLTAVPQITDGAYTTTTSQSRAGTGAVAMIYLSGVGWALGWNSMQYLLTAELYPLRIRAMSSSLVMCMHFANSYGNSRAVPNMLLSPQEGGLGSAGTFWMFAAVTMVGGLWVWVTIPETAGRSLETMDRVFSLPWYQIGLYGEREAKLIDEIQTLDGQKGEPSIVLGNTEDKQTG